MVDSTINHIKTITEHGSTHQVVMPSGTLLQDEIMRSQENSSDPGIMNIWDTARPKRKRNRDVSNDITNESHTDKHIKLITKDNISIYNDTEMECNIDDLRDQNEEKCDYDCNLKIELPHGEKVRDADLAV